MKKDLIVWIDCGDTLVDESTQVIGQNGDVISARMISGAREMLTGLYESGYRICLVADGRVASFRNIFEALQLTHVFEQCVISEELGCEKPDERVFREALRRMKLTDKDKHRIVMIGNNLKRDVLGANRFGVTSILLSFSPRYSMRPESGEEIPDYVSALPGELTGLLSQLDLQVKNRRILGEEPTL